MKYIEVYLNKPVVCNSDVTVSGVLHLLSKGRDIYYIVDKYDINLQDLKGALDTIGRMFDDWKPKKVGHKILKDG